MSAFGRDSPEMLDFSERLTASNEEQPTRWRSPWVFPRAQARPPADEITAEIVAKRRVEHLKPTGVVVMKGSPEIGAAALCRGDWPVTPVALRTSSPSPREPYDDLPVTLPLPPQRESWLSAWHTTHQTPWTPF